MKDVEAGGAKIPTPVRDNPGLFALGFIEDPWGTIEVVQDTEALGFHHVHLRVPDPAATLTWYQETFGGERAKLKGRIEGLRGQRLAARGQRQRDTCAEPRPRDLQRRVARDERGRGGHVPGRCQDPGRAALDRTVRYAFVEDPNGVQIELIHQQP
jgi:catechol 2,3-dioxygenase-like lactoylglutathione lyase family enzyme